MSWIPHVVDSAGTARELAPALAPAVPLGDALGGVVVSVDRVVSVVVLLVCVVCGCVGG